MLNYSKGSLDVILYHNSFWAFLFIIIYYFIFALFMHTVFHYIETDAAKTVILQTGFQTGLLEQNEIEKQEEKERERAENMNEREKRKELKDR